MFKDDSQEGFENEQESSYEENMVLKTEPERGEDHGKSKKIGKGKAGILAILVLLLVKLKSAIMLLLPFLKGGIIFAKMGKFAGTFISMILTVLIYMQAYGLPTWDY